MTALVVAVAALALLVADMRRASRGAQVGFPARVLRVLPFAVAGVLSLWVAGRAPSGRQPFQVDLSLSARDLLQSMSKVPHLRSTAVLFLLAALAVGSHRLVVALLLTILVGVGWELAEATVVGHHARLADLAPDLVAGLTALAIIAAVRGLLRSFAWRRSAE
jgi:hypothetical protein